MKTNSQQSLKRGLKNRHLQMIALGGAIGTGLFYGSASTIQLAGPAISLSYLIGGCVIFFIMRMLGEMAVDNPVSGSFSSYANTYWHEFVGFLSGWNYWMNYVIVSMVELTAVGIYINYWLPDVPQWLSALICLVIITVINLINVKLYGEFEFCTAIIKVVAICCMIIFGIYIICTDMGTFPENLSNLWSHGGYLPNGWWGLALSLVVVMFSFGGVDLIGITAGEAENPEKTLPKAINQILIRILIFYIGTMVVLMSLSSWDQVGLQGSPFVQIFSNIGIPAAANILNFVVLVAALSAYNGILYGTSRMLYGLAKEGNAPKIFASLSRTGIPMVGILVSAVIGIILVIMTYYFPKELFMYLLSIVVAGLIISWFIITITHMKFRLKFTRENRLDELKFKSLFYPYTNYFCILFLIAVVVIMTQIPDMLISIIVLPIWVIFIYMTYLFKKKD